MTKVEQTRAALHRFGRGYEELLRRICKFDPGFLEFLDQSNVDGLLQIHEEIVIRREHPKDKFVDEGKVTEALEVGSVESDVLMLFDDPLDHRRDRLHVLGRGLVNDSHTELDPPLAHPPVVPDPTAGQVAIGENQLLAREAEDTRGLESHMLHGAV